MKVLAGAVENGLVFDAEWAQIPAADILETLLRVASGELRAPFGFRVRRAFVSGLLDLSGTSGPQDTAYCPIKFLDCIFTEGLRLDRARFKRLSLHGSVFHRLQARDAEFLSTLDLRDVRSPALDPPEHAQSGPRRHIGRRPLGKGECSIDLANAMIDGDVWLHRAVLQAGAEYGDEATIGPYVYALTLRGAEVRGAVRLEPAFVARGGVTVADAHIHGDLRMHGAELIGMHGAALRAQNARVDGIVYCRADTSRSGEGIAPSRPFVAQGAHDGALIFQNAKLGRLDLRGALVEAATEGGTWAPSGSRDRAGVALDLSHAVVSAGVVAGAVIGPTQASRFTGWVTLRASRIQGDVSFSKAGVHAKRAFGALGEEVLRRARAPYYAMDMRSADIRGSVRLDNGFEAEGGVTVADANIGGDLILQGAVLTAFEGPGTPFALRGRNTSVSGVLRCGNVRNETDVGPLVCHGGISFPNASMDKAGLDGITVNVADGDGGIDFSSARIRGGFSIQPMTRPTPVSPTIRGKIDLRDANIQGDVIVRAAIGPPQNGSSHALLTADGARVSGDFELNARPAPTGHVLMPMLEVRLSGAAIGRDLKLNLPGPSAVLTAPAMAVDGDAEIHGPALTPVRLKLGIDAARIGRSLDLRSLSLQAPSAAGMKIGSQFILAHSRVHNRADFRSMQIAGSMDLFTVTFERPGPGDADQRDLEPPRTVTRLDLSGSRVTGPLRVRGLASDGHEGVELDLTDVSLGILDDLAGTAWPESSILTLRGLTYNEIKFDENETKSTWVGGLDDRLRERHRKSIAANATRLKVLAAVCGALAAAPAFALFRDLNQEPVSAALFTAGWYSAAALALMLPVLGLSCDRYLFWRNVRRVHHRLSWLDRQFGTDVNQPIKRFVPQPYTQLAKAYRSQGRHAFADVALVRRARMKARTGLDRRSEESERGAAHGPFLPRLWGLVRVAAPNWLYDVTFRYGFSPGAAVGTILCYLAFGFCLTMAEPDERRLASAASCSQTGYAALMTLERVVPPLDLDSASLCSIPAEREATPASNNVFWAFYGLLGWIITSMATLTLTGVLRRFAEH